MAVVGDGFGDSGVREPQNHGGEQATVDGSGLADGQSAHGDAWGHLDDGQEGIQALHGVGFAGGADDGDAQHRECGLAGAHAREVGGSARPGDDDPKAAMGGGGCIFEEPVGGAVGGDDGALVLDREIVERAAGVLHGLPVGGGAHDDADEGVGALRAIAATVRHEGSIRVKIARGIPSDMRRWLLPALAYFGVVFAIGFVLGAVRELLITPRLGRGAAVWIELPFMVVASVVAARWVVARWRVERVWDGWWVGLVAFAMLMVGEYLIALIGASASPVQFVREATSSHNLPGLAAQVLFAVLPAIVVTALPPTVR